MGAPKKPTALRELHGTLNRNKDRNNPGEPVPTKGIGPAPEHLNEMQSQAWDEIVGMMYPGVLGEADRIALEIMAKLLVDFRTNYEDFTGAKLARLEGMLARFGMTPSDRTKIVVPKGEKKNPFSEL